MTHYDENFVADAELDHLSELQRMANERGFESVEEMQEEDNEAYLRYRDMEEL